HAQIKENQVRPTGSTKSLDCLCAIGRRRHHVTVLAQEEVHSFPGQEAVFDNQDSLVWQMLGRMHFPSPGTGSVEEGDSFLPYVVCQCRKKDRISRLLPSSRHSMNEEICPRPAACSLVHESAAEGFLEKKQNSCPPRPRNRD